MIHWYVQNRLRNAMLPLERWAGDGQSLPPRYLTLKPTLRCNLRCEFCRFVANGDVFGKRDWLGIDDWRRIVDEVAPYRPYICITGGEPTLYPHLPQLIAHIKQHGLICVLTTNGTMLEHRAEALLQAPPDVVVLSLDGPRDVHDAARKVTGTFDRALRGVRALHAPEGRRQKAEGSGQWAEGSGQWAEGSGQWAEGSGQMAEGGKEAKTGKLEEASARRGPYLVVNTAITGRTWESAREMTAIARDLGALAINFQHFWFLTRSMVETHNARWGDCFPLDFDRVGGTATEGVDTEALFEMVERLKREDSGLPVLVYPELDREQMRVYYGEPERFTHRQVPSCAWTSTDILPNGDVSPCFELVAGNVLERPFREIWNTAPFRDHRRRLATEGPYPVCARCCAYFRRD